VCVCVCVCVCPIVLREHSVWISRSKLSNNSPWSQTHNASSSITHTTQQKICIKKSKTLWILYFSNWSQEKLKKPVKANNDEG